MDSWYQIWKVRISWDKAWFLRDRCDFDMVSMVSHELVEVILGIRKFKLLPFKCVEKLGEDLIPCNVAKDGKCVVDVIQLQTNCIDELGRIRGLGT